MFNSTARKALHNCVEPRAYVILLNPKILLSSPMAREGVKYVDFVSFVSWLLQSCPWSFKMKWKELIFSSKDEEENKSVILSTFRGGEKGNCFGVHQSFDKSWWRNWIGVFFFVWESNYVERNNWVGLPWDLHLDLIQAVGWGGWGLLEKASGCQS